MIQELFGGGASLLGGGERKISNSNEKSSSPSPSLSGAAAAATTTTPAISSPAPENQNLRCPRCDSPNTKFCYYNNYNLTQPRHFCKTCRRYWTRGGALRNIPIGGGCRKNKSVCVTTSSVKRSGAGKPGPGGGFGQEVPPNSVQWAGPQGSHLLGLLRSAQNPSPNFVTNSVTVKEESVMIGSHLTSESTVATGAMNASAFWRNNQFQLAQEQQQNHHHQQLQTGFAGYHDFYQRLGSTANYYPDHSPLLLGNVTSSSPSSTILESAPVHAAGEMAHWNPTLLWSDLQTTNGAYPN